MKIKEAIVVCGGSGTRIASVLQGIPKVLAPVAGKPFLYYVLNNLREQGIKTIILALGFRHEDVETYIRDEFFKNPENSKIDIKFSVEKEPIGTGGAILLACGKTVEENIFITNGDTLFKIDIEALSHFHLKQNADCTLALKPMTNFDRYGAVETGEHGMVHSFREKSLHQKGLINGGCYILNQAAFAELNLPAKFSFEKDYLEKYIGYQKILGMVQDEYFIDIGVPKDLERARKELSEVKTDPASQADEA